ncbi:type IV conjugative transfer system lipoprotein TraV, partial [Salmonella enterica]|uniref:type IV conjugative transfer system lipoprotein TraV n=1 Tax=Salmonella enterica TaxID=28901 RepID=UPI0002A6EDF0
MNRISCLIPFCGVLLLSGCAGTNSDFECTATTSDTCMTMEQANEKAKRQEQPETVKPGAVSLPHLAEGNFRTTPVQTVSTVTPTVGKTVAAPRSGQNRRHHSPLFTAVREVKTVAPVSTASPVVPPRPLRTGEQTAVLWIAPYIDSQDIYHQPSGVFFVIK